MQDYIPIKRETLLRFANEARRLGGTENDLSTEQMIEIFSAEGGETVGVPIIDLYSLGFTAQEIDVPMQYKVINEETYRSIFDAMSTGFVALVGSVLTENTEIRFVVGLICSGAKYPNDQEPYFFRGTYSDGDVVHTLSLETNNPADPTEYAVGFSVCTLEQVSVDLTGYATERWVQEGYQPKGEYLTAVPDGYAKTTDIPTKPEDIGAQPAGNYLTEVPSGYAKKSEIPTKVSQLQNDSGYLTKHQDISGKLDASALPTAINTTSGFCSAIATRSRYAIPAIRSFS